MSETPVSKETIFTDTTIFSIRENEVTTTKSSSNTQLPAEEGTTEFNTILASTLTTSDGAEAETFSTSESEAFDQTVTEIMEILENQNFDFNDKDQSNTLWNIESSSIPSFQRET